VTVAVDEAEASTAASDDDDFDNRCEFNIALPISTIDSMVLKLLDVERLWSRRWKTWLGGKLRRGTYVDSAVQWQWRSWSSPFLMRHRAVAVRVRDERR